MSSRESCPKCGAPVPDTAVAGLCRRCLLTRLVEGPDSRAGEVTTFGSGPGKEFGEYELLNEIARGGMGVIYKARQVALNRIVALKMIQAGRLASEPENRRFRLEAESVALLDHPHIVPIYEVGEHEGRLFFTMKLVEGGSLAERLALSAAGAGRFTAREVATLMAKIARAVHYAHQRGILHRDLKPGNILLDDRGEPFVSDFGLAKQTGAASDLTLSGCAIGTPNYMSPEQAAGKNKSVTTASDIYSLGAIFYELLAGRPPFQADTPLETMRKVVEEEPVLPSRRAGNKAAAAGTAKPISTPHSDRDLETICLKCLQKVPAQRYASAEALADDLERWLRGEPIRARPSGFWEQGTKWAKRHPARATLVALALLAPAIIVVVLLVTGAKVKRERDLTRINLYAVDVALAWRALEAGDFLQARESLAAYRGGLTGRMGAASGVATQGPLAAMPGFEWRWLWHETRGDARKTFAVHQSWVDSVAYSPDGRWVASASADGTAQLWDATQEKWVRSMTVPGISQGLRTYTDQSHELRVAYVMRSVGFSPDSGRLLTCSGQGLELWDVNSGRSLWSFRTNGFSWAGFSPTDPNLALAGPHPEQTLMGVLDPARGAFTAVSTNGRADVLCFMPDGRRFARWDREAKAIWLQDAATHERREAFSTTNMYVQQLAFSGDGRILAAANLHQGPVELFEVETQRRLPPLVGPAGRGHAVAISRDSRWLASGGTDQIIRLWDLAARKEVRQLRGHRAAVYALAFSPDGRTLVSGGFDGTVRFWDLTPALVPPPITNVFGMFAFSPDGRWLVAQNVRNGIATLWELPARRVVREWASAPFESAAFPTTNRLLTARVGTAGEAPCVRAFAIDRSVGNSTDKPSSNLLSTTFFRGITSPCTAIVLSPNGRVTVTGHADATVAVWDTNSGKQLAKSEHEFNAGIGYRNRRTSAVVNPLVISQDGGTLAAISYDIVEVRTWALPGLRRIGGRVFGAIFEVPLALSPDGRQLAMGGMMQGLSVNLWDADLRKPGARLRGHQDFLYAVAYSPDGRTLASGGRDGVLKLWHVPTERELGALVALPQGVQYSQVTFSPDGTWLGASDTRGELHLWNAPLSEPIESEAGH